MTTKEWVSLQLLSPCKDGRDLGGAPQLPLLLENFCSDAPKAALDGSGGFWREKGGMGRVEFQQKIHLSQRNRWLSWLTGPVSARLCWASGGNENLIPNLPPDSSSRVLKHLFRYRTKLITGKPRNHYGQNNKIKISILLLNCCSTQVCCRHIHDISFSF